MAKQIIWTKRAQEERKEILQFWRVRNQSTSYSKKLNGLIKKAVKLVAAHPHIGRRTDIENVRVKLVRSNHNIQEVSANSFCKKVKER